MSFVITLITFIIYAIVLKETVACFNNFNLIFFKRTKLTGNKHIEQEQKSLICSCFIPLLTQNSHKSLL